MAMPSIRGAQIKANWSTALDMAAEATDRDLRAALGDDHIRAIERCLRTGWVPIEHDLALSRAVEAELGEGKDYERSRRSTAGNMSSPLMTPFLEGARRLFGLEPAKALKLVKPGWRTVFRDCGTARYVNIDAHSATFAVDGIPGFILECGCYVGAIAGSMHGLLDICEVDGRCDVARCDPAGGVIEVQMSWTPRQ